jgi:hypothetical protein
MLSVFTGERLIGPGSPMRWVTALGVLLVLGAMVLRFIRVGQSSGDAQRVERQLVFLYALGTGALLLYFVQSDLFATPFGKPLERDSPKLAVALAALWPALWLAAATTVALVELAYGAVARAPRLELGRIKDAMYSGLGLAGVLVFAFSAYYVASERDHKWDLSYFRTARPGESTRKIVRTLDQAVTIATFFPPANEVAEEIASYTDDLGKESKLLEVKHYDAAIDVQKAKDLGVSGNGTVVVSRGGRKEQLSTGLELEAARTQLKNFDKEVQKRLLQVARPGRTVYLTTGHGERGFDPVNDTDKRATVRDLRDLMQQQGYLVRTLGAAEGLAADVPADAAVVLVVGPQKDLLPEESQAIVRYLERGGRLLVALDPDNPPEAGADLKATLAKLGLTYNATMLANDQIYARRTRQAVDRTNIATGTYSSHPSVTSLGRLGLRAPLVMFGAGYLEEQKGKDPLLSIDFTVRAHPATWADPDHNYEFDKGEVRKPYNLAAAVVKKRAGGKPTDEMRAIVVADSDAISDGVLGNPGNAYFAIDGLKWLVGDEGITGEISNEQDIPIAHTRKQDVVWFYASIFLVPALWIGLGLFMTRRARAARGPRAQSSQAASAPPKEGA